MIMIIFTFHSYKVDFLSPNMNSHAHVHHKVNISCTQFIEVVVDSILIFFIAIIHPEDQNIFLSQASNERIFMVDLVQLMKKQLILIMIWTCLATTKHKFNRIQAENIPTKH